MLFIKPSWVFCTRFLYLSKTHKKTLKFFYCLLQGKIYQIDYAMEAVKQGSATVGLKSKDYAVLVALKVCSWCFKCF